MISQMVSGTKPVRRFPAVYRHYSPTVARRLVRTPDERIRVDPSAAARGVCHLAVVHSRKHSGSGSGPPTSRRSEHGIGGFHHYRAPFDIRPQRLRAPSRTAVQISSELLFPDVFSRGCVSNSAPTRRDTKNAIRRLRQRSNRRFSGPAPVSGGSSWCQRLRGGPAAWSSG